MPYLQGVTFCTFSLESPSKQQQCYVTATKTAGGMKGESMSLRERPPDLHRVPRHEGGAPGPGLGERQLPHVLPPERQALPLVGHVLVHDLGMWEAGGANGDEVARCGQPPYGQPLENRLCVRIVCAQMVGVCMS